MRMNRKKQRGKHAVISGIRMPQLRCTRVSESGILRRVALALCACLLFTTVFVGCGTVCANFQTTGLRCLALNQHSLGVTIMTMAVQIAASIGPFVSVGTMSGIQGAVGEAQSALGYEGAWLLAALVCAMGSLLARWACRRLWKWRRNNADAG